MMAEGGEMPQYAEGGQMSEGMKQLQMLKAARDKAIEEKNMEMIGKIETVIKDMYDQLDERGREVISELFPDLDFMMDSEEEASEAGMMAEGGELKMVENDKGEKVPFYAADGKGKMAYGGAIKQMMSGGYVKEKSYPGGGYFRMK